MSPNTPGLLGYAWALVVTWLTLTVELVVVNELTASPSITDPVAWARMLLVAGAVVAPVGGLGTFLAHRLCRDELWQGTHVLVAGGCTGMLTLVPAVFAPFFAGLIFGASVLAGLAAMVGRVSVIPLVRERQQDAVPAGL